mmetsp:Transcript_10016/g.18945  ORF Transcript_10016/g.18945 Transcript_10016/m.18945 type:complete len:214 (-) Transcript_10016:710-1351(-)
MFKKAMLKAAQWRHSCTCTVPRWRMRLVAVCRVTPCPKALQISSSHVMCIRDDRLLLTNRLDSSPVETLSLSSSSAFACGFVGTTAPSLQASRATPPWRRAWRSRVWCTRWCLRTRGCRASTAWAACGGCCRTWSTSSRALGTARPGCCCVTECSEASPRAPAPPSSSPRTSCPRRRAAICIPAWSTSRKWTSTSPCLNLKTTMHTLQAASYT